jgi:hypothetical protein
MKRAVLPKFVCTNFPKLRSPDAFASGVLLNKSSVKQHQLKWQSDVINRSMSDFAGDSDLNKLAIRVHKAILGECLRCWICRADTTTLVSSRDHCTRGCCWSI